MNEREANTENVVEKPKNDALLVMALALLVLLNIGLVCTFFSKLFG